ncbi:MAG: PilN domain-containing protein [Betaproteobacteria bacterium]
MATTSDNLTSRSQAAVTQRIAAFWRWWTNELAQLVPEAVSPQGRLARLPQLEMDEALVQLVPAPGAPAIEPRSVDLSAMDLARARAAVRELLERAGENRGRARLALGHRDALVRRVTLPLATEENLAQVLGFEMDRLTPFRAEDVYHDERILSRDTTAGTLVALLAMARRDLVDARLERLRALGVSVQGVSLREEPAHPGPALDLLPVEQRGERETRGERILRRVLAAAVVVLVFAVLFVPIWQKREAAMALNPVVQKARQEAEATDSIARQLEREVGDYNFLLAKKHGAYPALAYIEEISRLLPDHTWVQELQIKNTGKARELQIQGETSSSSKLLETLSQSALMQDVNTRGTVTRGSTPGSERFMIAALTKARPQPESVALADLPTPVTPTPAAPAPAPAAPAKPAPVPATVQPVSPPAPAKASPAPKAK